MTGKAAAFIYARSDSRRLPGKIFLELGGHKVIDIVHARAARLDVGNVVMLTTGRKVDDPIASHCAAHGYNCLRGNTDDLVQRTLQALELYTPHTIVRVNGDCPLFEPTLANAALEYIQNENGTDMVSNIVSRTFPYGISVECMSAEAYVCHAGAAAVAEREHVTQHLYRLADQLSLSSMRDSSGDNSNRRLTLDTVEDARQLTRLFAGRDVVTTPYWEFLNMSAPSPVFDPVS